MHRYIYDRNRDIKIYLVIAVISIAISYLINKLPINTKYLWIISLPSAFACYGIFFELYNYVLWKILCNFILGLPNLNGIWEGKIISDHDKKETLVQISIKQNWRKIKILMITDNSRSYSVSAYIYDDSSKIIYNYITRKKS